MANLGKALEIEAISTSSIVAELERRHRLLSAPYKRIAVLGADSGPRSTLSAQLAQSYGYCDLLRKEREQRAGGSTTLFLDVPSLVKNNLDSEACRRGMVLDGEPASAVTVKSLLSALEVAKKPLTDCLLLLPPSAERPIMLTSAETEGVEAREEAAARDTENNLYFVENMLAREGVRCKRVDPSLTEAGLMAEATKAIGA